MSTLTFHRPDLRERVDDIHRRLHTSHRRPACVIGATASLLADRLAHDSPDGGRVIRLLSTSKSSIDSFDPLDVVGQLPQYDPAIVVRKILEPMMQRPYIATDNPASDYAPNVDVFCGLASELLAAVMEYEIGVPGLASSLIRSVNRFYTDDVVYNLAVLLDTQRKVMSPNSYAIVAAFLQCADRERALILALINEGLSGLNSPSVQRAIDCTSFDLRVVQKGEATVFLEAPPRLASCYRQVVRVWLMALLQLLTAEDDENQPIPLLIVDDPVGLELLPQLSESLRLAERRIEVWSYWDDLSQLQVWGPARCSEYLGRHRRIDALGRQNPWTALKLANLFSKPASELFAICPGERRTLWDAEPEAGEATVSIPMETSDREWNGHAATFASARMDIWGEASSAILGRGDRTVVVVESAGRCHELTAEGRAQNGPVIRLDPFGVLPYPTDTFNPLGALLSKHVAADVYQVAELIVESGDSSLDPFWQNSAISLLRAVIQYFEYVPEKPLTMWQLWKEFHSEDVKYDLAVVLDTIGKRIPPDAYQDISQFLQTSESLRVRTLAHVRAALIPFGFSHMQKLLGENSFNLETVRGGPATIYIEMPPHCTLANGQVIRIVLATLIQAFAGSPTESRPPALFIIDNAFALALLSQLTDAERLLVGQVEMWSFWESFGQIQAAGPLQSAEYLSGLQRIDVLGPQDPVTARELAEGFGGTAAELSTLSRGSRRVLWNKDAEGAASGRSEFAGTTLSELAEHVVTIGHHGAGKWRQASANIQQRSDRLVAVFETSGDFHALTAQTRESRGRIIRLDPSGIFDQPSDHFNPFDLLKCVPGQESQFAFELTELLVPKDHASVDPFWRLSAASLVQCIIELLHYLPERRCALEEIQRLLRGKDHVKQLADEAESHKDPLIETGLRLIRSFLRQPEITRESILMVADKAIYGAGNPVLSASCNDTTFPLDLLTSREPVTIYVEMKPQRPAWQMTLARCWLKALLEIMTFHKRPVTPMIVVDSPISHEAFSILTQFQRSNAIELWTFFNDAQSMETTFPVDWPAFLMNASRINTASKPSR